MQYQAKKWLSKGDFCVCLGAHIALPGSKLRNCKKPLKQTQHVICVCLQLVYC